MSSVVMWESKWVQIGTRETINEKKEKVEVPIYVAQGKYNKEWHGYKLYKKEEK